MEFSKKKYPKEQLQSLYRVKIETVKPFALMLGPAYLYLRANEKFVSVKGPLDFFTEPELLRLQSFKYFYFPEFVTSVLPFREAGQKVRSILNIKETSADSTEEEPFPEVTLPPAPFECSDQILRVMGPLWWEYPKQGLGVEPFLVTIFVNEVCDLFPRERLMRARERDIEKLDRALVRSSWVVFLALHLGYCDLEFLNDLRLRAFDENIDFSDPPISRETEIDELFDIAYQSLKGVKTKLIKMEFFAKRPEKVSQKLFDRFERIRKELASKGPQPPTIYGKRGFIDV